ncbi:MAG TPA: type II toxin-antitoxin system VapC family toxin [Tepidisphaeraceae bacterium]|nr:type II toxin-antitoxin system VapC family toxin [Tepidisphaeraceae bacterium]
MQEPSNELLLSAGTTWEIAIKMSLNKLTLSLPFGRWMNKAIADLTLSVLPITVDYAEVQAGLPFHHRDPFDRLLVAQAIVEKVPIVTADSMFDSYGIKRIWDRFVAPVLLRSCDNEGVGIGGNCHILATR